MIEASNAGKMFQDMMQEKDLEMTDEVKKLFEKYLAVNIDAGMKIVNIEELMNDMIPAYDKFMSNEDVLYIAKFYESSAGKRMIEATPKIAMEYMPAMMEKIKVNSEKIKAETEKNAKDFTEKLDAIKEKQKKAKEDNVAA